jgi:enamine deaminase RidA (YjgF/YER057c/UK114 family)
MTFEERLLQLGLTLPPIAPPVGSYVPCTQIGSLLITSGQLPLRDGRLISVGKLGTELSLEQGAEAARTAALNAIAQLVAVAKGLDRIARIVRVGVFVNSAAGFTDQAKVANGASDLFVAIFGDAGRHVRTSVGVNELPLNAPVEVEVIAQIASGYTSADQKSGPDFLE